MSIIGAVIGAAAGIFGGAQQDAAANKAAAAKYKYDKQVWDYNWKESLRQYDHAKEGVDIARTNDQLERAWRNQAALQDWAYGMKMRKYEYENQVKAYNKSEETYAKQLSFNNMAADIARESEDRFLNEQFKRTAFENQDLVVQMIESAGDAQLLQSGKSAGKAVSKVLADLGRNQAVLAESLVSASKQHKTNLRKIASDKYGADLAADAARMLKPTLAPALPKPKPLPAAIFQDPLKPKKPPKPIKGAASSAGLTSGIVSGISGIANAIDW